MLTPPRPTAVRPASVIDRNAHPERIHRAGVAVVGEGIEAQIQLLIAPEIREPRDPGNEFDAIGGDAALLEQRAHGVAGDCRAAT